jgi:membrane protein implicated in regulation of membrane protease activity
MLLSLLRKADTENRKPRVLVAAAVVLTAEAIAIGVSVTVLVLGDLVFATEAWVLAGALAVVAAILLVFDEMQIRRTRRRLDDQQLEKAKQKYEADSEARE